MQSFSIEELTPKQVINFLDKYIIGQEKAKKSLAIVLRNRWRRQQVKTELREEITPRNILMIGPRDAFVKQLECQKIAFEEVKGFATIG